MKFKKIYHLPFSEEIHKDDHTFQNIKFLLNVSVIITEKLDGANTLIYKGVVRPRAAMGTTTNEVYSYIKNIITPRITIPDLFVYGENMYAIHSIEYDKLPDYFFVFAIKRENIWLSWNETVKLCNLWKIHVVPKVFEGRFVTEEQMKNFLKKELKNPSKFGSIREGFVVRVNECFTDEKFYQSVAKYVRKGHVQTDEHWTKTWKKAKINRKDDVKCLNVDHFI